jgi:transposase
LLTERELERRAQRRLALLRHVEEVSFNVAATCRYYGISRQCYYGWLRRHQVDGLDGLKDRSSRPHTSPKVTQAEVIEKIVWLRKHYHFGPAKIAMYLARYHDVTISTSGVWRILNVYAVRMAGVFMISLRTIGMRTRMMPRWLVLVSYLLALVQLLVISVNLWVTPVFPAWVLALSAFLLAENRRRAPALPAPVGTGPGKP